MLLIFASTIDLISSFLAIRLNNIPRLSDPNCEITS